MTIGAFSVSLEVKDIHVSDVRDLQKDWQAKGIELTAKVDETISGPGFITLLDPDGNQILIDQHR